MRAIMAGAWMIAAATHISQCEILDASREKRVPAHPYLGSHFEKYHSVSWNDEDK
ncbi:hypothetical protein [Massilia sp.]|uniref:hypothetical protein n=1 Tax=Massilia sp. TaxID=1882437 RepID=UPI0028A6DDCD|nr:hypothetical protein [Massilia sp.]